MKEFMNYDFNIKNIVLACFVATGTGSAFHKDRPNHGLAYATGGEKIYTFSDGTILSLKENNIIYLPKNSTYTVLEKSPGDCFAINFDISENISFPPFVSETKNPSGILKYFSSANNIWEHKKTGYIMKCKADLYNVIYSMQKEHLSQYYPKNRLEIIKKAVDYIHENYTSESLKIDELSALCDITPEYFRKIFKSFYGISPIKYINNLKITRAKELLESKLYSVSEVATQSGYNELCHFSREFKKHTGFSPSEFLKKI